MSATAILSLTALVEFVLGLFVIRDRMKYPAQRSKWNGR